LQSDLVAVTKIGALTEKAVRAPYFILPRQNGRIS
jgi:hypothetical protein